MASRRRTPVSVDIYWCRDFPLLVVWTYRFCFLHSSFFMKLFVPKTMNA